MKKKTILQNEYATLVYYPDEKIVHHVFHKPIGGKEFREVLNTGAETLRKYDATKWLSDDRENAALSDEDTAWAQTDWFPRVVEAGWKQWAIVVPHDLMARLNMKVFVDNYAQKGIRTLVFTDPDEAMQWLLKK